MDDLISDEDELYCLIVERDKLSILKEEFSGILERFEELTDCRIVVEDQKELWGDEKPSQVLINIFGKGKDIAVVGQRLTTLVKDPTKLKRKQCSESVANLINSWSYLTLKEFQQKHTVLIDATQSPILFLESWKDNLEIVHRNLEKHTLGPSSSSETAKTLNDINILLLGQSGSGKTMFINSLKFYLTHTSIEDAMSSELEPLIPTLFNIYTSEGRKRIVKGASYEREPEKKKKMSDSDTQVTSSYVFSYRNGDETRNIRLIDTPGLADTKGLLQDEANLKNIMSFLADFTDLHAIILVMPTNQSRCNVNFQFCIDSFLKQLHNSASANIRVCLTNCRATRLKPGASTQTLQDHFQELQKKHGIDLFFTLDDPFCFENDCCQYMWAKSLGHEFKAEDASEYEKNYSHSHAEAMRLLETVLAIKPHKVRDSISINEVRKTISILCKPLAAIIKMITQNVLLIEEKQKELAQKENVVLSVDQVQPELKPLDSPKTVCTANSCVVKRYVDPKGGRTTIVHRTCHPRCWMKFVQTECRPNRWLYWCGAMNWDGKCSKCGCSYTTHMHLRYEIQEKIVQLVESPLTSAQENTPKNLENFVAKLEKRVKSQVKARDFVTNACKIFAGYLKIHTLVPFSDAYADYIDYEIETEKNKGNKEVVKGLSEYKENYKNVKELFSNSNSENMSISIEEVHNIINKLRQHKIIGPLLREAEELEHQSLVQSREAKEKVVFLKSLAQKVVEIFATSSHSFHNIDNPIIPLRY